jgi:hypothetical protein
VERIHDDPFFFPAFFVEFDETFRRLVLPLRQLVERLLGQLVRQRRQLPKDASVLASRSFVDVIF